MHDEISLPKYDWMIPIIEKELSPFKKKTRPSVKNNLKFSKKINQRFKKSIIQYRISKGQILGQGRLRKILDLLNHELGLPDMEFYYFEQDGIVSHRQIPRHFNTPILAGTKIKEMDNIALFLDPCLTYDDQGVYDWDFLYQEMIDLNYFWNWEDKIEKLFWRGANTGPFEVYDINNWKDLTRGKLVALSEKNQEHIDAKFSHILEWKTKDYSLFCKSVVIDKKMPISQHLKYKYQIVIDGDTCCFPATFWRLLSNSVLFMPDSDLIQWYHSILKPWVHYIPVKKDYSDLIEKINWAKNHDDEAKKIADQATALVQNQFTMKDIYIFCYKFLVEYAKLYEMPSK